MCPNCGAPEKLQQQLAVGLECKRNLHIGSETEVCMNRLLTKFVGVRKQLESNICIYCSSEASKECNLKRTNYDIIFEHNNIFIKTNSIN